MATLPTSIHWDGADLYLLDQTQLPLATVIEKQDTVEQVWDAIKQLKVRGAPAIGIAGAYGLVVGLRSQIQLSPPDFLGELERLAAYLDSARPTAVNLHWALTRMVTVARRLGEEDPATILITLEQEAIKIHDEDRRLCRAIGEHGLPLIQPGMGILTHCNAGALATSELGTALAPLYLAHQQGVEFRVYADETRPLLQGARLTSWELQQSGLDVTLICDNMAAHLMGQGLIDLVIVGTDRVAANGDVANKIGTLGVAIAAQYFGIPFYVACPYSTIDFATAEGRTIVIEERGEAEVTHFGDRRTAPLNISVRNPAFDVTPHTLVTGLITDRGILRAPYIESLKQHYAKV
ncbi:S-methyl-5-thioribose-1-phosphate isomerase [Leptolyngbya sp. PCC 6406]|uniref:S-methyl-5-thioribose-1-phosphate isomerase n=1 Tax=Leptolyngbya sp. PCC 6406 TaxID=1173264 RepID=UPI0002ABE43F|nr:S-methyl-5-thioribose-1-phosphate isomerase [Leptolyngbya sp. PCC 6406]